MADRLLQASRDRGFSDGWEIFNAAAARICTWMRCTTQRPSREIANRLVLFLKDSGSPFLLSSSINSVEMPTFQPHQPRPEEEVRAAFLRDPFTILRRKLSDADLLRMWSDVRASATTGDFFGVRGWYLALYRDIVAGKRVLDVGCGMGIDGITFAQAGAKLTFVDIVDSNLELVRRLCYLLGIASASFCYLDKLASLRIIEDEQDIIWCQGSMINAPFEVMQEEAHALLKHLRPGGRWIELAYPRVRWEREGRLAFNVWGEKTDGAGTPWMEWYDLAKLLRRLAPMEFDVILAFEFHNSDFNWFDLRRRS
jgi:SAM-dependent methyltransferase